jgi:HEAT repeat protein
MFDSNSSTVLPDREIKNQQSLSTSRNKQGVKRKEILPDLNEYADALIDKRVKTRRRAVITLGQLQDERAVELLISCLKDDDFQVRQRAIKALGKSQDLKAITPLKNMLLDDDKRIKDEVRKALNQIFISNNIRDLS